MTETAGSPAPCMPLRARPVAGFGRWERQIGAQARSIVLTKMIAGAKPEKTDPARPSDAETGGGLSDQFATLGQLDSGELRAEWRRLYRAQAPRLSRDLLIRGVAHRLQELGTGGMSKATRRKLAAFAKELEANGSLAPASSTQLRPGARLVREWRGRTHTVAVLKDGFEYGGKVYASLTKIAQTITGAHWSGPRFFGLIDKKEPADSLDDDGDHDAGTRNGPPIAGVRPAGGAHA